MEPLPEVPAESHRTTPPQAALALLWGLLFASAASAAQTQAAPDHEADQRCLNCHGQAHIAELLPAQRLSMVGTRLAPGEHTEQVAPAATDTEPEPLLRPALFTPPEAFSGDVHAAVTCVECHRDAAALHHAPELELSTCTTSCHVAEAEAYARGKHGSGEEDTPGCATCHGGHTIVRVIDKHSAVNRTTGMALCVKCHESHDGETPAGHASDSFFSSYLASTHGRAYSESGLTSAAMCIDCHSPHEVRTADDPLSKVHRNNIPETCGACHAGIEATYETSVHGQHLLDGDEDAPVCTDCHTAHSITRAETPAFMLEIVNECGSCHDDPSQSSAPTGTYYRTYRASYHGQVNKLGSTLTARCSDCHGSHDILPLDDPNSRVFSTNLIETCGQAGCHPGANANFVRFDPHADYHDAQRSPVLFGVWVYFIVLMSSVFAFFGLHTLLWFVRGALERLKHGAPPKHDAGGRQIRRFTRLNRINHGLVVITFLGLSATGIPLAFAGEDWAPSLAWVFGGIEMAGIWHRCFGFLLLINVAIHVVGMLRSFIARKQSARSWAFGPNSLVPNRRDVSDCLAMFRWFFRGGKAPGFDRWTYFEKFDYWCEIGGTAIIGGSGLLLWFPELASWVLPGWAFNVAMVVHGYEALLAMGFIFTIHFFNANLRIGKFPVDKVIFSGRMPEEELAEERPAEYARLAASGELEELTVRPWPLWKSRLFTALGIGAMLFATGLLTLILLAGMRTS